MNYRTAVAAFALAAIVTGTVAGCAMTVPSESMSVIEGNDILTADLGADVSARGVVLAAVLLVAGDIIKTVAVAPTLENMAVLGAIVVIRTFLSFSLELEINGRWPWQARSSGS